MADQVVCYRPHSPETFKKLEVGADLSGVTLWQWNLQQDYVWRYLSNIELRPLAPVNKIWQDLVESARHGRNMAG